MGQVFRVWDPDLERELALKVARGSDRDGSRASNGTQRRTERFLAEARITGRLQHPGIVAIHEIGLDPEGRLYYTMPLIEGEDLERVLERVHAGEPGWTTVRALGLLQRVCETVAHAHERGVVHGDLKPANVRVGRFGEVTVMDWGLARPVEQAGEDPGAPEERVNALHSQVAGTPAYLAPERARDPRGPADPRDDVYAAGAML
jgi:serine/threonine-protein kinase